MTNIDSVLKSRDMILPTKVCLVRLCFSSIHVWMWELDYKESWVQKNWCLWTVMLEKTLESPMEFKQIKLVNLNGNQPWVFTANSEAEAENSIFWPPDAKSWLIGKDPDAGKDWRQKEEGAAEDEMVRYLHQVNGQESDHTLGDNEGQSCSPCSCKESDMA